MVVHPQTSRIVPDLLARMTGRRELPPVTITDVALSAIAREALRSVDGLETGGILLGYDATDGIGIRHAGGPGPNAARGKRTFMRDLDHARRLADSAWLQDRSQWIGEWHTHPEDYPTPSGLDRSEWRRLATGRKDKRPQLSIIVGRQGLHVELVHGDGNGDLFQPHR